MVSDIEKGKTTIVILVSRKNAGSGSFVLVEKWGGKRARTEREKGHPTVPCRSYKGESIALRLEEGRERIVAVVVWMRRVKLGGGERAMKITLQTLKGKASPFIWGGRKTHS